MSDAIEITIDNPQLLRFALRPIVLSAPNRAPVIDPIPTLNIMPGDCLELRLTGTDADGDAIHFTLESEQELPIGMLTGQGVLKFTPAPSDVGEYTFSVIASDGQLRARQDVTLNVVADTVTTTRVSGTVLDTNQTPLANVPMQVGGVEVLTDDLGRFEIDLSSIDLQQDDTLRILGNSIPGNFPFIAEKLDLLLGHDVYDGVRNVVCRPIFLPGLNGGTTIDPTIDTTVSRVLEIGEAATEVFVAANSLMDQQNNPFTGALGITEVPVDLTPAALPGNLFTDIVVTIQPGDMVFTTPAPLTFPNRSGWEPGTMMNLWSINPVTGRFDDVGDMQVSADGLRIETISGGIRNSSWHLPVPMDPPPDPCMDDNHNRDPQCDECQDTGNGGSEVELHSGAFREWHNLVTYQSLGVTRGLSLHYDSERADPQPIIHFGYSNIQAIADRRLVARVEVTRGDFCYQVPGNPEGQFGLPGGENFWSINGAGDVRAALQQDFSMLPSGTYDFNLDSGILRFVNDRFTGSTTEQTLHVLHVNGIGGIFGNGWGLQGLLQIVENPDGSVLLIDGDGGELYFDMPVQAGEAHVSPPGDFTTLLKQPDGTFQRTWTDGTVEEFNSDGFISVVRDRNGNETQYDYAAPGRLTKWIDPVGLETQFIYTGDRVTQIIDPANHITEFNYDPAGNLQRITDPDTSQRDFEYDALSHMTAETDKRNDREQIFYNFAGKVERVVLPDGTEMLYDTVQAQVIMPSSETSDPSTAPAINAKIDAMARHADANGNVTESRLDQQGQAISKRDSAGAISSIGRDGENLVTRFLDGRGNLTSYEYDSRGNVVAIRDTISSGAGDRIDNLGQEFWISFQQNLTNPSPELSLFLSGPVATSGSVEVPGTGFSETFAVVPGQVTTVALPNSTLLTASNAVSNRGVHITADAPIAAYGLNRREFATDGFLALPVRALGTEYLAMSYRGAVAGSNNPQLAIVGTQDNTDVTIVLPTATGGRPGNSPFTIQLDEGEAYYLHSTGGTDLTGASISASQPVAVFGGHRCANVPPGVTACDHLVEQLPPLNTWGTEFVTVPLATRLNGDTFRFLASTDDTEVFVNNESLVILNGGQVIETVITDASRISSTKPILVAQFSNGSNFDGVTSDPFMVIVPPFEQFVSSYTVSTPASGFASNFINVVSRTASIGGLRLDGQTIPADEFASIGDSGFSAAQLPVELGTHNLTGSFPFGIFLYGFDNFDSYGYLGGQAFEPVQVRTFTYDPVFSQMTSMTDELGHKTLYDIDPANGNRRQMTGVIGELDDAQNGEADDLVTAYTYTVDGLVDTMTDPLGHVTDYDYNARQLMTSVTYALGTVDEATMSYEYDLAGNRTAMVDGNGNRTEYEYDGLNRLTRTIEQDPDGAGPLTSPVTVITYDAIGNVDTVTDANGNTSTNRYDDLERLIEVISPDPDGTGPLPAPVTTYSYDPAGNMDSITDPNGHVTSYDYDARNRRVAMTDPDGGVTRFSYDTDNNLTRVVDPVDNVTRFVYDARDRLIEENDPFGEAISYQYDAANNLIRKTDRNERVTHYAYDDVNRLLTEEWLATARTRMIQSCRSKHA